MGIRITLYQESRDTNPTRTVAGFGGKAYKFVRNAERNRHEMVFDSIDEFRKTERGLRNTSILPRYPVLTEIEVFPDPPRPVGRPKGSTKPKGDA